MYCNGFCHQSEFAYSQGCGPGPGCVCGGRVCLNQDFWDLGFSRIADDGVDSGCVDIFSSAGRGDCLNCDSWDFGDGL